MPHHTPPACPQCGLENTYHDGEQFVCPDCAYEWQPAGAGATADSAGGDADGGSEEVRDANGNLLANGDAVILVKDLKVKGSSTPLKKGTKIKSIRLVDAVDGHNIDCKTDLGSLLLKSEFVKKA